MPTVQFLGAVFALLPASSSRRWSQTTSGHQRSKRRESKTITRGGDEAAHFLSPPNPGRPPTRLRSKHLCSTITRARQKAIQDTFSRLVLQESEFAVQMRWNMDFRQHSTHISSTNGGSPASVSQSKQAARHATHAPLLPSCHLFRLSSLACFLCSLLHHGLVWSADHLADQELWLEEGKNSSLKDCMAQNYVSTTLRAVRTYLMAGFQGLVSLVDMWPILQELKIIKNTEAVSRLTFVAQMWVGTQALFVDLAVPKRHRSTSRTQNCECELYMEK